jgi:cytochrome c oxidase subunit 2
MKLSYAMKVILVGFLVALTSLGHTGEAQTAPKRIEITAKRFTFQPAKITLKKGEPVVLVVKSADVAHSLRCRELNLDIKVNKGAAAEAPITPAKTGDFIAHCGVFCGSGHGEMVMSIHVED